MRSKGQRKEQNGILSTLVHVSSHLDLGELGASALFPPGFLLVCLSLTCPLSSALYSLAHHWTVDSDLPGEELCLWPQFPDLYPAVLGSMARLL